MMKEAMLCCLLGMAATGPAHAQTPAKATTRAAPDLAADPEVLAGTRLFSAWMESRMAYRGLPGAMVGVIHGDRLIWSKGYGFADVARRTPMTANTKFRMASHSKMLAAIAILQLREQGKLRLDDPVEKHLPWFRVQPASAEDGPITVEQLLSHSSGLQREASDHWSSLDFPTREELVALMSSREAAFAPQTRWKYSNLAFGVAGLLVEQLSSQPFADYAQANILGPLGMTDSSFDRPVPGLAVPYGRRLPDGSRETLPFVDARGMAAATGLTSTLADMARFVSAQFSSQDVAQPGRTGIVSPGTLRELHRVRSIEQNWETGTGLGFASQRVKDRTWVGHGGGYPGYTTQTLFQPDDRVGVIVLTNTNDSDPAEIARQLIAAVAPAVAKAAAAPAPAVAWDPAWARFQGVYRNRSNDWTVVLMHDRLALLSSTAPSVDAALRLVPLGNGRFRLEAPVGGVPVGETVRFGEERGKPMRLYTGDSWSDRVSP